MAIIHTEASETLSPSLRSELRTVLDVAFAGRFSDDDWDHALGGWHVWLTDDAGRLVSHASVVARRIACAGTSFEAGYVEAVATLELLRGQGSGTRVMRQINALIHRHYELGALAAGSHRFYETLGWERWRGATFVNGPEGRVRTAEEDEGVMVLRTGRSAGINLEGEITCEWRPGAVW